jgi:hypothetical protein
MQQNIDRNNWRNQKWFQSQKRQNFDYNRLYYYESIVYWNSRECSLFTPKQYHSLMFAMSQEEDYWILKDKNSLEDFPEKSIDFKKTIEKIANNWHKIAKQVFVNEQIVLN